MRATLALLATLCLAGCSSATSAAAAPSPAPTFGVAPIVTDVCATVDTARVRALFHDAGLTGANHPGVIAPVGASQRVCSFGRGPDPDLLIGIAPIPMSAAVPGPEEALRDYLNTPDYAENETIDGVGDLAIYQPFGTSASTLLVAVKGTGLRYYGITVRAYDPTPGRTVLGGVSRADLVALANRCLARV